MIAPEDARWAAVLQTARHDFYHLPAYARMCADEADGDPVAMVATDGRSSMLLPLILRPVGGGRIDATSRTATRDRS